MSMNMPPVPPMPEPPKDEDKEFKQEQLEELKKQHKHLKFTINITKGYIAVAVAIILAGSVWLISTNKSEAQVPVEAEAPTATPFSPNPPSPTTEIPEEEGCFDKPVVVSASTEAEGNLRDASRHIKAFNLDAAVDDLNGASDAIREAAIASEPDPAVSRELYDAADDYADAAYALDDFRLERTLALMNSATTHIRNATAAVNTTTVPAC